MKQYEIIWYETYTSRWPNYSWITANSLAQAKLLFWAEEGLNKQIHTIK